MTTASRKRRIFLKRRDAPLRRHADDDLRDRRERRRLRQGFIGQVSMEAAQRAAGDFRALCSKTLTKATTIFDAGLADALAFLRFPIEHHRSIATTNPIEHLNKEIRRRTRSIGIFPSRESALRLITMILIEQSEEWMVERRYMSPESLELVLQN